MSVAERQDKQTSAPTIWERLKSTSWFIRGALGAWPLLAVLEAISPFEKIEILRALHAIILSWNEMIAWLGQFIGRVPFVPNLPEWFLNSFAICSLFVFGNVGYDRSSVYFPNRFPFKNFLYTLSLLVGLNIIFISPEINAVGYFAILIALLGFIEGNVGLRVDRIVKPIWWFVVITFLFYTIYSPFPVITELSLITSVIVLMMIMGVQVYFSRPNIKKGVLFSLGFIIVFTVLYALNQPIVKKFVNERTSSVLDETNKK